jgi:glycosyltransferase involved in cell wall biosynthesis
MLSTINYGGAWRRNFNLLKAMKKVNKRIDYTLLLDTSYIESFSEASSIIHDLEKIYQVRLIRMPLTFLKVTPFHYVYLNKLRTILSNIAREEKPDLLYVPHELDWFILAIKQASKGIPWTSLFQSIPLYVCQLKTNLKGPLSTIIDSPSLANRSFKKARGLYRYARLRLLVRDLEKTLILSTSKTVTSDIRFYYPQVKIKTLNPGMGVDLDPVRPSPEKIDAIFFTSELIPQKGFLDLPFIWKKVTKRIPDASLWIVGKIHEPYYGQFRDLVEKLNLNRNVYLHNLKKHDELMRLVKSSRVMLYPSKFDTFGLVILEALSLGLPVVAYDIPSVRLHYPTRSVINCEMDDLECMANNVLKILLNLEFREDLSKEALSFSSGFSWEAVAKEEAQAYNEVLNY